MRVVALAVLCSMMALGAGAPEYRAIWVWASTVDAMGAEAVAKDLAAHGLTDAVLLVKGNSGKLAYASKLAPRAGDRDTLQAFLAACHARGIRVHAWLNYNQDEAFAIRTGYRYSVWHAADKSSPRPYARPKSIHVCPLRAREEYNGYYLDIVREVLERYAVDGIHLDAIRYADAAYCFCPAHQKLMADGGWVERRISEIDDVVAQVKAVLDRHNASSNHKAVLSAALMPEPALPSNAYGLRYYAQSYEHMARSMAWIAPMSYSREYSKPPSWVGDITAGAVARSDGKPILAGLQTYKVSAHEIAESLHAARAKGAAGFAFFRYGVSAQADAAWKSTVPTLASMTAVTEKAFASGCIADAAVKDRLLQSLKKPDPARAYLQALDTAPMEAHCKHALSADAQWLAAVLDARAAGLSAPREAPRASPR